MSSNAFSMAKVFLFVPIDTFDYKYLTFYGFCEMNDQILNLESMVLLI